MPGKAKKVVDSDSDSSSEIVVAQRPKGKADAKAVASKKVAKKQASSSESSDDEPVKSSKLPAKKPFVKSKNEDFSQTKSGKKVTVKKPLESSDESSEDEKVLKKRSAPAKKSKQASDSDSDSDDEPVKKVRKESTNSSKAPRKSSKASSKKQAKDDSSDEESEKNEVEDQKEEPQAAFNEDDKHKNEVIIKRLPYKASEQDVREFFEFYGPITRLNLLKNEEGRSKGIAFATFEKVADCQKAIAESGQELMGMQTFVEASAPRSARGADRDRPQQNGGFQQRGGAPTETAGKFHSNEDCTIFVGNLNFKSTPDQIWDLFGSVGGVKDVRFGKKPDGSLKGFCHVEFNTSEDASKGLGLNQTKLDGRPLNVDLAGSRGGGGSGGARPQSGGYGGGGGGSRFGGGGGGFGGGRGGGNNYSRGSGGNDERKGTFNAGGGFHGRDL